MKWRKKYKESIKQRFGFLKNKKIDKSLARLSKKIENPYKHNQKSKWDITSDATEIQKIIRNNYKQLYSHKLENPEKMNKLLETDNLPRLNQEEIELLSGSINNE